MRSRILFAVIATVAAVALTACGSSGGSSSVSTSQLVSKLKNDSKVKQVINSVGTNSKIGNELVTCIAKAIKKNASRSDLSDYVKGDKSLNDISGNSAGAEADAKTCAQNAVKSAK